MARLMALALIRSQTNRSHSSTRPAPQGWYENGGVSFSMSFPVRSGRAVTVAVHIWAEVCDNQRVHVVLLLVEGHDLGPLVEGQDLHHSAGPRRRVASSDSGRSVHLMNLPIVPIIATRAPDRARLDRARGALSYAKNVRAKLQ